MLESVRIRRGTKLLVRSVSELALIDKEWFVRACIQAGFRSQKWFAPFRTEPISYDSAEGRVISILEKKE
jgi:hypothetical protein